MLALAAGFTLFFFRPALWREIGGDSKVFYASASLASRGGNPYDPAELGKEQDRLFNRPAGLRFGQDGYMYPASYAYPPLFTRAMALGRWMPWPAFYLAGAALMLAAGLAALEVLMRAIGWEDRALARAFLVVSSPMATTVFDWNPSAVVLLVWAAGFAVLAGGHGSRRAVLAGAILSLGSFKLALGIPVALALLTAGVPEPRGGTGRPGPADAGRPTVLGATRPRLLGLAGFAAGCAALLGINLAVAAPGEMSSWLASMTHLGAGFASTADGAHSPYAQTLLAGLPAMLMDNLGTTAATLVAIAAVVALLSWAATGRRFAANLRREPLLAPAIAVAAALAVVPYLHANDLLLDALPLLVAASIPFRPWSWLTPLAWFAGPAARFGVAIVLGVLFGLSPNTRAGYGVVMSSIVLLALALAARYAPAEAPPAASQRR